MRDRIRIMNVVGARPNFMKIAPLMSAYRRSEAVEPMLIHTGQHYDENMSRLFFHDLGIPEPDFNLEVGSGSHAVQTAEIMKSFEPVVLQSRPDAVLVVGDVNGTIACGLVAVKLGIPLVHVEAGLRSGDRTMPEEINRVLTDAISDLLFCTERSGVDNLAREGIGAEKAFLVGNLMVDSLLRHRERCKSSAILETLKLLPGDYAVLTLHRPSNVDDRAVLTGILDALAEIQKDVPIVLPLHPRLRKALVDFGLNRRLAAMNRLRVTDPLGYLDFLRLMSEAGIVLTDSGGIQEETTILRVPCLTLRENTERPVTLDVGTNRLAGTGTESILTAFRSIAGEAVIPDVRNRESSFRSTFSNRVAGEVPPLWDGHAAVIGNPAFAQRSRIGLPAKCRLSGTATPPAGSWRFWLRNCPESVPPGEVFPLPSREREEERERMPQVFPLPWWERGRVRGEGSAWRPKGSLSSGNQRVYFLRHFCLCSLYLTLTPALSRQGRGGKERERMPQVFPLPWWERGRVRGKSLVVSLMQKSQTGEAPTLRGSGVYNKVSRRHEMAPYVAGWRARRHEMAPYAIAGSRDLCSF